MTMTTDHEEDRAARVAWAQITEPGESFANELIDSLGAPDALATVLDPGKRASLARSLTKSFAENDVAIDVQVTLDRWAARHNAAAISKLIPHGVHSVIPGDEHWPTTLDDLGDEKPLVLWVRGDASLLATKSLAIVGARAATGYGEHVTMEISSHVADAGITVLSGAAYGIDGMAHRAALASGGKTVAVLAGGVDRAYPAGHTALVDRIAEQGALVSESLPGSAPTRQRFIARSRLIAALSGAVLVTEASARSGSLAAAHSAVQLGRPVGAVPGPVTSAASTGSNLLIRDRTAVLVSHGGEALELLGRGQPEGGAE